MSLTNSDLVSDALREIGVLDETETASAEQFADGIKKLNQMMELWEESGIKLEYFAQSISSDTCPIPPFAEQGVTSKLAIRLASTYRAEVTPALIVSADDGYSTILRISMNRVLPEADLRNRPRGEGQAMLWDVTTAR